jgi:hypothetical protein
VRRKAAVQAIGRRKAGDEGINPRSALVVQAGDHRKAW